MNTAVFEDAFNLLCGAKLGEGVYRTVFECKLRPDLVVKVEDAENRSFANAIEHQVWFEWQYTQQGKWLAPCEYISPDGRILLQKRAQILVPNADLPKTMPTFLTDFKPSNYGWFEDRIVCVDYAAVISDLSLRKRKVDWV